MNPFQAFRGRVSWSVISFLICSETPTGSYTSIRVAQSPGEGSPRAYTCYPRQSSNKDSVYLLCYCIASAGDVHDVRVYDVVEPTAPEAASALHFITFRMIMRFLSCISLAYGSTVIHAHHTTFCRVLDIPCLHDHLASPTDAYPGRTWTFHG